MVTATGNVLVPPWLAWALGAIETPATSVVSAAALRPFSGSSLTCSWPITWERVPLVVSTWAALASTFTSDLLGPDLQGYVEGEALIRQYRDPCLLILLKALGGDVEFVLVRSDRRKDKKAVRPSDLGAGGAGLDQGQDNGGRPHGRVGGIDNGPGNAAESLGEGGSGEAGKHYEQDCKTTKRIVLGVMTSIDLLLALDRPLGSV